MVQQESSKWLSDYAATGSQEAFAALSRQYVDMVYVSARRQVGGDAHLAEDITQAVFIVLAQKAKSVPVDRPLSAWLMKVTRYCAANARRMNLHRKDHERRAAEMARDQTNDGNVEWNVELTPLLDEGLSKLRPADRDALLMKYFERKSLREVGEALGVSEEAAQKRVTRAVDRLRDFFKRRGATVSAVTLATVLTSESAKAAPASLAASISSSATGAAGAAGGSTAAATLAKGAMVAMATQKTTTIVIGGLVLLLGIGGGAVVVHSMSTPTGTTTSAKQVDLAAAPANGVIRFSDGTTVECVAMSEVTFGKMGWAKELIGGSNNPVQATSWWKPDGSVTAAPQLGQDQIYLPGSPDRRGVRFVFDTVGPTASGADLSIRIPNSQGYASSVRTFGQSRRTNLAASILASTDKVDIRIGLCKGAWRTDITTPVVTTSSGTAVSTTQPASPVTYGKISDGDNGGCTIELLRDRVNIGDRQRSIRVTTTEGKELWCDSSMGDGKKTTYHFSCPKEKLATIVWLSRPYEWGTLNGVSLSPAAGAAGAATATAPAKQ